MWAGWLELGNKYWILAVSFVWRSVSINPFLLIFTFMSKKGTIFVSGLSFAVNFMWLWWLFNSLMKVSKSCTLPFQRKNISSVNLLQIFGWIPPYFLCKKSSSSQPINRHAYVGASLVPIAVPIFWVNSSSWNVKMLPFNTNLRQSIKKSSLKWFY